MPRPVAVVASLSWLATLAAVALDPTHEGASQYVSWLSDGPYWALAAAGILLFALACLLAARRLHGVLPTPDTRLAAVAMLTGAAVLAAATVALPSRGHGESTLRLAAHRGFGVGGYFAFGGAAVLLAWLRLRGRLAGPRVEAWGALYVLALGLAGLAAAVGRFTDGPDLRGLAQLVLLTVATAWLMVAERVGTPGRVGPADQD